MAEGRDTSVAEDLEQEITCAICHDHYTDPKVLSCCHYYCKECVYRLALRTGLDKPFSCPECRKDTTLPQGKVDGLQGAFFINRMKQVHSKVERATGKVEAKCEMCSGAKAEAFCRQCVMFICAECVKQHQKMRVFAGHKVSSLQEIKEGGAKEVFVQEPTLPTCQLHHEPMKIYCFDCSHLICRDCSSKDHLGHNYEFVTVAGPAMKKQLIQQLEPLNKTRVGLSRAVQEIQSTKSEVKAQTQSVITRSVRSIDELKQILEDWKQELIAQATNIEARKLGNLCSQEKGLSMRSAEVQSVTDYTVQCVEHSTDDEIMCMHVELQSLIDRAIQEQQEGGRSLEPVEEADMSVEVSCAEQLKQLCQTKAKITLLPDRCTITTQPDAEHKVGKPSQVVVKTFFKDGTPTKQPCNIQAQLKSLVDRSTIQCQVEPVKGGEYRVQFTPTVRGRHQLTVTLNGQEVAGSPLPVFVSIHPSQLGKPVRVITGFQFARHVTVNSAGETIVTDKRTISVFNKSGKKLRNCELSKYNILSYSWSGAVDSDGCMYVTDDEDGSRKVVKLSSDLKLLCEVVLKEGSKVRGVALVGDEIMVCDRDKCVMVYTKELKYVRSITSNGDGSGQSISRVGISSDQHGNVYICDPDKSSSIHIFKNDGGFLCSFGKSVKLKNPLALCVSGQYVYVSDYSGHKIEVFTTEGEHVATFGQGSNFANPLGVCVDDDGFVYVCDKSNNRLQVF